jgi:hypothetical protein
MYAEGGRYWLKKDRVWTRPGPKKHGPAALYWERLFATEKTIGETTHIETSSPPATRMLLLKTDLKHQQNSQKSISKRPRILTIEPTTITTTTLIDRLNQSTMVIN